MFTLLSYSVGGTADGGARLINALPCQGGGCLGHERASSMQLRYISLGESDARRACLHSANNQYVNEGNGE